MAIEIGKVKVSVAALIMLLTVYILDSGEVLFALVISAAVHELGHAAALWFFGKNVAEIRVELVGATMWSDTPLSYRQEIITALSGPMASLVLALLASAVARSFHSENLYLVAGVSLVFLLFNMLPVYPLDGGMAEMALCCSIFGPERAEKILCVTSCAVILLMLIAGSVLLIITRVNISVLIAAIVLLFGYCQRSVIRIKSKRINNGCESWIKN